MLKLLVFPFTACWMLGTIPRIPFRKASHGQWPGSASIVDRRHAEWQERCGRNLGRYGLSLRHRAGAMENADRKDSNNEYGF
jgi:hypothetical protein